MSCAAPPGQERPGSPASKPGRRIKKLKRSRSYRTAAQLTRFHYVTLLLDQYALGLLHPFSCSRCGQRALDPLGWDGPRRPLCGMCADGNTK
jgi:hypothetical protein